MEEIQLFGRRNRRAFRGNRIVESLIHQVAGFNLCATLPVFDQQMIDGFGSLWIDVLIIDWRCGNLGHAPKEPGAAGKRNCKLAAFRGFRAVLTVKNAAKARRESGIRNALGFLSPKAFGFIIWTLQEK